MSSSGPFGTLQGPELAAAARRAGAKRVYGPIAEGMPPPAAGKHTATVIWLHGLGDTGFGWVPVARALDMPHVKFLFPTAPSLRVTLNGGMEMPSWFDIFSLDPEDASEDESGIWQSAAYLMELVDKEVAAGVDPRRVVLAGFSQGGAVALAAATMADRPLGGFLGLSTWLPLCARAFNAPDTPVLMCHGDSDFVVQHAWGQESHRRLTELGVRAEFKTYRGLDHGFCDPEQRDVAAFLRDRIP